jgi:hypothetical protein
LAAAKAEGFNFLGFNIRMAPKDGYRIQDLVIHNENGEISYDYEKTLLLIKPSEKSITKFKSAMKRHLSEAMNIAFLV